MSVFIKARPKSIADLPDWAKCCPAGIAYRTGMPERLFDISTVRSLPAEYLGVKCGFCGCSPEITPIKIVYCPDAALWTLLDQYDLDEGIAV